MHSKKYDNRAIWVACCECQRGGNGNANKCSCGGHIKKWDNLGCFSGQLTSEQIALIDTPVRNWYTNQVVA